MLRRNISSTSSGSESKYEHLYLLSPSWWCFPWLTRWYRTLHNRRCEDPGSRSSRVTKFDLFIWFNEANTDWTLRLLWNVTSLNISIEGKINNFRYWNLLGLSTVKYNRRFRRHIYPYYRDPIRTWRTEMVPGTTAICKPAHTADSSGRYLLTSATVKSSVSIWSSGTSQWTRLNLSNYLLINPLMPKNTSTVSSGRWQWRRNSNKSS